MRLSQFELDTYHQRGYVVPDARLEKEQIDRLKEAVARVIAANPETRPERLVSVHINRRNDEGVHGDSAFFELANHSLILDRVEQILGSDLILWGCQLFCKPPDDGMEVPMHQDGHYWPIRPLATCTAWVAIDDSTAENGCLRVVPGSHRGQRHFEHARSDREEFVLNRYVNDPAVDESLTVDIELEAGQFSLHDVYLIHGSNPNTSGKRRAGVSIRFMPATSRLNRNLFETGTGSGYLVNWQTRPLWLLRGVDRAGNDFEVGHSR